MLVAAGSTVTLGASVSRVRFTRRDPSRVLLVDDQKAFLLSHGCGTCAFYFGRWEDLDVRAPLSLAALRERLTTGLTGLDPDVIEAFAQLLPRGDYLPLLLSVAPRLTHPGSDTDYFAHEQVATWGPPTYVADGSPADREDPDTPYYRTFETPVEGSGAHLYEFVVPMVPPTFDDPTQVSEHARRLAQSGTPTAVAVSTLDVCVPATGGYPDWYWHWGLTHFLLDGHHKMHAAAHTGRPLQLLSLVSVTDSLATPQQVAALPALRAQADRQRVPAPTTTPEPDPPPPDGQDRRSRLRRKPRWPFIR